MRMILLFCVFTLSFLSALSLPLREENENINTDISRIINSENAIRKRSTNADIGLNGSRSSRMQQLLRRYMLLTILENVKGKRSWKVKTIPTHSDGSLDYGSIAGVVLRNEPHSTPWHLVDMKRDIHSNTEGIPELYDAEGMSLRQTSDPEKDILHEIPRTDEKVSAENLPLLLMQAVNDQAKSRSVSDPRFDELVSDEMEGNTESKIIDLLKLV
uniref:uncharacterized protein LOC120345977 isoform X1 n=1 Tax=Styela clava TaxID=7725 RepID=UPI001939FF38|nr:uncharacterized protein LOC120345977 isoform X1 [Styela clava]